MSYCGNEWQAIVQDSGKIRYGYFLSRKTAIEKPRIAYIDKNSRANTVSVQLRRSSQDSRPSHYCAPDIGSRNLFPVHEDLESS